MQLSDKVKKLLAEKVGVEVEDIDKESYLRDDLNLDVAALIDDINQAFGCAIPQERAHDAQTVEQLVALIEEYSDE